MQRTLPVLRLLDRIRRRLELNDIICIQNNVDCLIKVPQLKASITPDENGHVTIDLQNKSVVFTTKIVTNVVEEIVQLTEESELAQAER